MYKDMWLLIVLMIIPVIIAIAAIMLYKSKTDNIEAEDEEDELEVFNEAMKDFDEGHRKE